MYNDLFHRALTLKECLGLDAPDRKYYAIPSKAVGYGNNSTAQNIFRITFSQALSTAPKYEAWDNSSTFPARDASGSTIIKEIFTGNATNSSKPFLCLVATTSAAPSSNWKPASATGGSANPNRLKGTTNFVTDPTTPGAAGTIRFNMVAEVPFDATVPSTSSCNYLLQIRYNYTGTAPTLTYDYNDGGSEGTPTWTTWTPGTHGMKHASAGVTSGAIKLTLPESSTVDSAEGWITT